MWYSIDFVHKLWRVLQCLAWVRWFTSTLASLGANRDESVKKNWRKIWIRTQLDYTRKTNYFYTYYFRQAMYWFRRTRMESMSSRLVLTQHFLLISLNRDRWILIACLKIDHAHDRDKRWTHILTEKNVRNCTTNLELTWSRPQMSFDLLALEMYDCKHVES